MSVDTSKNWKATVQVAEIKQRCKGRWMPGPIGQVLSLVTDRVNAPQDTMSYSPDF